MLANGWGRGRGNWAAFEGKFGGRPAKGRSWLFGRGNGLMAGVGFRGGEGRVGVAGLTLRGEKLLLFVGGRCET